VSYLVRDGRIKKKVVMFVLYKFKFSKLLTNEIINDIIVFNSIEMHNCSFKEMFEGLFQKIPMNFVGVSVARCLVSTRFYHGV
jgi:hypothetical protein